MKVIFNNQNVIEKLNLELEVIYNQLVHLIVEVFKQGFMDPGFHRESSQLGVGRLWVRKGVGGALTPKKAPNPVVLLMFHILGVHVEIDMGNLILNLAD